MSLKVLQTHRSEFGVDFAANKKALNKISIIPSKELKNEIAGHIANLIKKEIAAAKEKLELESIQEESAPQMAETQQSPESSVAKTEDVAAESGAEAVVEKSEDVAAESESKSSSRAVKESKTD